MVAETSGVWLSLARSYRSSTRVAAAISDCGRGHDCGLGRDRSRGWRSQRARSRHGRRGRGRFARALRRSTSSPGLSRLACLRAPRPTAPSARPRLPFAARIRRAAVRRGVKKLPASCKAGSGSPSKPALGFARRPVGLLIRTNRRSWDRARPVFRVGRGATTTLNRAEVAPSQESGG